ncbi:zinc-dependent alcohol dehydrogenase family protein [Pantoea ananatis]|jgi:NADPH:quinone reductase-like Zn-dependent oxidoreductase|uniref:zinc-dependent alcohol dehydrogenase family protein n=1 Tax=Pantoea ananas TaxID=553 RepID=UPI000B604F00|nr:NAD(P)-dependent alcohol dehydrogenase [Pantoea ananatis]ASN16631.1 alcohol dehydrogenase [Pantoea ananatis]MDC7870153.1 alcohol dehydrogenase [Pantoea ananatis]PKC41640.1 NADPH:quinone oxidoreductase [Pantoea ananatis BRT98]PQK90369.1 NAD(P)-dependent alcohol dehydrogenase [Pantoea ananatis]PWV88942.1 NADPH:quinone reductase-like Zn-dependent oxidoreductase [Pantoea ananatis]
MKSFRVKEFGDIDFLEMVEECTPQPGKKEVLIKIKACSLNHRDISMLLGTGTLSPLKELIPCSDGAGEIVEIGKDVTRFVKGDRVAGIFFPNWLGGELSEQTARGAWGLESDGWLTQYKVISEEALVRIPSHLSYEEASTLPCAAVTAWNSLLQPRALKAGETVLIQGTGGVSLFCLQFAKLLGLKVIALTSTPEKEAMLRKLNADHIINYKEHPEWHNQVKELTNGKGVDRIIEVGGPGTINNSLKSCSPGGEIIMLGFVAGSDYKIDYMTIYSSGAKLIPLSVGSREDFESMNKAISFGKIKPVISEVFRFEETKAAWIIIKQKKHIGKVVIKID